LPERTGLPDPCHGGHHFSGVLTTFGNPVQVHSPAEVRPRKELHEVQERDDSLRCGGIEPGPISDVLFRPEEVHGTSGTGKILEPLPERDSHISGHILGFYPQNDSISDLHLYGLSAIEARGIDANHFAGKKPADR